MTVQQPRMEVRRAMEALGISEVPQESSPWFPALGNGWVWRQDLKCRQCQGPMAEKVFGRDRLLRCPLCNR